MPDGDLPNPSFIVLIIPRRADVPGVEAAITARLEGEEGRCLTWLGGERYALSRGTMKQLGVGLDGFQLRALIEGFPGVTDVDRARADEVLEAYRERPAGVAEARVAEPSQDPWNLRMIKARRAWAAFPGGLTGKAWRHVRVGHLDTGYTEHPVFGPWHDHRSPTLRPAEGINYVDSGDGLPPRDPLNQKRQPGHGTRTSSVLAGYVPRKFLGVAPQVGVVPYRVTNHVVIDSVLGAVPLDRALLHAVFDSACHVISISLGDPCFPSRAVGRAVDKAYEEGVIIAAAAGNITSEVTYPGRYARTIAAGGVTRDGVPWTGGSRGQRVDLCAPAADISRADAELKDGRPDYVYGGGGDGTSYATVHVSGAAALWRAFHGNALARYQGWQVVEAYRSLVTATAARPADWNADLFGAGILDIAALLEAPLPDPADLRKKTTKAEDEAV